MSALGVTSRCHGWKPWRSMRSSTGVEVRVSASGVVPRNLPSTSTSAWSGMLVTVTITGTAGAARAGSGACATGVGSSWRRRRASISALTALVQAPHAAIDSGLPSGDICFGVSTLSAVPCVVFRNTALPCASSACISALATHCGPSGLGPRSSAVILVSTIQSAPAAPATVPLVHALSLDTGRLSDAQPLASLPRMSTRLARSKANWLPASGHTVASSVVSTGANSTVKSSPLLWPVQRFDEREAQPTAANRARHSRSRRMVRWYGGIARPESAICQPSRRAPGPWFSMRIHR